MNIDGSCCSNPLSAVAVNPESGYTLVIKICGSHWIDWQQQSLLHFFF
jgi:hypothetical protein